MEKKVTTSIKIPASLEKRMLKKIIEDGYGMRGKGRWIKEAIENFLRITNFQELVDIASEMEKLSKVISIRLPEDLVKKLDAALIIVRKAYPDLEGVKSNIIRASIMQRLIRK
jgi:predicted DNA-binding protein